MADGTYKPISEIEIGDWVMATDPETGEQVAKRVTHLWIHPDTLTDLVINTDQDGDGQLDRITTTEDHPFWNATDHEWQEPQDFDAGDDILTNQWRRIDVVGLDPGSAHEGTAYNLTVQGIHTYHVSTHGILVHNTKCGREGVEDAEAMRVDLDADVVARLDLPGRDPIYGVNAHGQSYQRPPGGTPVSAGHAETDAFGQAARLGHRGGEANLHVAGLPPCGFCKTTFAGWAKELDLDVLNVFGPAGYMGRYVRNGPGYRTLSSGAP